MARPYKNWASIFKEWQASGETKAVFCRQHGHCRKYFNVVCRRYGPISSSDFIQIKMNEPPPPSVVVPSTLRITTPCGFVVELS